MRTQIDPINPIREFLGKAYSHFLDRSNWRALDDLPLCRYLTLGV